MRPLLLASLLLAPFGCSPGGEPVEDVAAEEHATLYYLLAEPTYAGPSLITPRDVRVEPTGDPG